MFINPQHAIKQGWIKGIKNPEVQVQPNAIDFTVDKVFTIHNENTFIICTNPETGKEAKQMRGGREITPLDHRGRDTYAREVTTKTYFHLQGMSSFDILSDVYVEVPEGVTAILVARSTFIRNGLFLVSGLYDSGFKGHIGCVLHNLSGTAQIEQGTRVGQIIFVSSENAKLYGGSYNHDQDTAAPHQSTFGVP